MAKEYLYFLLFFLVILPIIGRAHYGKFSSIVTEATFEKFTITRVS